MLTLQKYLGNVQRNLCQSVARLLALPLYATNGQSPEAMTPIFDPEFSEHSYGFRPGRSAQDAVRAAQQYAQGGKDWVVDIDITKFFDQVDGPPPEGGGSCNGLEALFRLKPAEGYPHQAGFNK